MVEAETQNIKDPGTRAAWQEIYNHDCKPGKGLRHMLHAQKE